MSTYHREGQVYRIDHPETPWAFCPAGGAAIDVELYATEAQAQEARERDRRESEAASDFALVRTITLPTGERADLEVDQHGDRRLVPHEGGEALAIYETEDAQAFADLLDAQV